MYLVPNYPAIKGGLKYLVWIKQSQFPC